MNAGTQLIITWHLSQQKYPDEFIDMFIDALYDGCKKREQDALRNRDILVAQAMALEHGDMEEALNAAFEVHMIRIGLDHDQAMIDLYAKLEGALPKPGSPALHTRISEAKVQGILEEVRKLMASTPQALSA